MKPTRKRDLPAQMTMASWKNWLNLNVTQVVWIAVAVGGAFLIAIFASQ